MKRAFYAMFLVAPIATLVAIRTSASDSELAASKNTLRQERAAYQQTVLREGAQSPRARTARENLRTARRSYFNQRRTVERSRPYQRER